MAGRKNGPPTPAMRELRLALDQVLKTAAGFDRLERGAGERIRREGALALKAVAIRAVSGPSGSPHPTGGR